MAGREVFKHAVRSMADATDRALDAAKLTGKDIDLLIPHQANVRIIEATAKHANVSMDKVYVNVDRYGNTSSASVPIAVDEAIECGRITEGTTVLLVAFGAGFTWASMVVRVSPMDVVLLFPGQGAQKPGMGKDVAEAYPAAKDVFARADAALGTPLSQLCFEGPAEELTLTHNAQPALLAHGAALWAATHDV